ncbi:MAG: YHYH protein [Cyclobacteriaceae bacterium]
MKYLSSLLNFSLLFLLLACGGDDGDTTVEPFSASVSIGLMPSSVEEGQLAQLIFTLSETNTSGSALTVGYSVDGSASTADFTALTGTASIAVGQATTSTTIATIDDSELEPTETLTVTLNPDRLAEGLTMGSANSVELTITDNDEPPAPNVISVSISIDDAELTEGEGSTATISLSEPNTTGANVVISYELVGNALNGEDFEELSGSATIADGQSEVTFAINSLDDETVEASEMLTINLLPAGLPENYELAGSKSVQLTILDNDTGALDSIEVSLATSMTAIDENGTATVTIDLSSANNTGSDVVISYDLSGTASEGMDYEMLSRSLTIGDGEDSGSFEIKSIDDAETESDETIVVTLSASGLPENFSLSPTSNSVEITIMDDDEVIVACSNDNSIDQDFYACNQSPSEANNYSESVSGGVRTITTNGVPEHDFRNQVANLGITDLISDTETYTVDATPTLASSVTGILKDDYTPNWKFGVAVNGVPIDPAPGTPFIFTNTNTGEFNWDWVFEPTNNMERVGLDCNIAHLQPDQSRGLGRIHYHGDMADYADDLLPGIGSGTTTPTQPLLIGWAADGFPIVYKFGPNASGSLTELQPSYRIKSGQRPGDGVSEPCGEYNGKYTNDYEYSSGLGDLDECNGISQSITVGGENFSYFYVITDAFPVISRCISGTPDQSFKVGPG